MPVADINFGELLLLVLEVFLFVAWLWILFAIVSDLFRDHELSGWGKAAWVFFLLILPFLGALVYLIARGDGMRDRAIKAQEDAKSHFDAYIREQAHSSPADELHKLDELKEKGALSPEEFERAKAKLLAWDGTGSRPPAAPPDVGFGRPRRPTNHQAAWAKQSSRFRHSHRSPASRIFFIARASASVCSTSGSLSEASLLQISEGGVPLVRPERMMRISASENPARLASTTISICCKPSRP
jgi:putative oligomerization/nucleic acid binding protein/phospholipase D-like protein